MNIFLFKLFFFFIPFYHPLFLYLFIRFFLLFFFLFLSFDFNQYHKLPDAGASEQLAAAKARLLMWLVTPSPAPTCFLPLSLISISSQQISVTQINSPEGHPPILEGDEDGEEEEGEEEFRTGEV